MNPQQFARLGNIAACVKTGSQSAHQRFLIRQRIPQHQRLQRADGVLRTFDAEQSLRRGGQQIRHRTGAGQACGIVRGELKQTAFIKQHADARHHPAIYAPCSRQRGHICEPPFESHHRVAAIAGLASTAALGRTRICI